MREGEIWDFFNWRKTSAINSSPQQDQNLIFLLISGFFFAPLSRYYRPGNKDLNPHVPGDKPAMIYHRSSKIWFIIDRKLIYHCQKIFDLSFLENLKSLNFHSSKISDLSLLENWFIIPRKSDLSLPENLRFIIPGKSKISDFSFRENLRFIIPRKFLIYQSQKNLWFINPRKYDFSFPGNLIYHS